MFINLDDEDRPSRSSYYSPYRSSYGPTLALGWVLLVLWILTASTTISCFAVCLIFLCTLLKLPLLGFALAVLLEYSLWKKAIPWLRRTTGWTGFFGLPICAMLVHLAAATLLLAGIA